MNVVTSEPWPAMRLVRQRFDRTEIPDFEAQLAAQVRRCLQAADLSPGSRVAIGVGSRGISPLRVVVATVVAAVRRAGLDPYVVPAMGSHGGGTAAGQAAVLDGYGISTERLGVPVEATMDTVVVGQTAGGVDVHLDAAAARAAGIIVIGRVKPHTGFRGPVESGLCKMLAIGLGNRAGAESVHAHPLAEMIPSAAAVSLGAAPVLCGIAMVENAFDRPYAIEVARPEDFLATDRRLLEVARQIMPRVPLDRLDVLIVDRMGKNISGSGLDPNVVGMWRRLPELAREPDYRWLAVLGLTAESGGNATGLGLADLTSQKLVDAIDPVSTQANALTSLAVAMAKVPLTFATDLECVRAALALGRRTAAGGLRVARVSNTMQLETLWVSEAALPDLPADCEVVDPAGELAFDPHGAIVEAGAFAVRP